MRARTQFRPRTSVFAPGGFKFHPGTYNLARYVVSERRAVATRSRRNLRDDPIATAPGSDTKAARLCDDKGSVDFRDRALLLTLTFRRCQTTFSICWAIWLDSESLHNWRSSWREKNVESLDEASFRGVNLFGRRTGVGRCACITGACTKRPDDTHRHAVAAQCGRTRNRSVARCEEPGVLA